MDKLTPCLKNSAPETNTPAGTTIVPPPAPAVLSIRLCMALVFDVWPSPTAPEAVIDETPRRRLRPGRSQRHQRQRRGRFRKKRKCVHYVTLLTEHERHRDAMLTGKRHRSTEALSGTDHRFSWSVTLGRWGAVAKLDHRCGGSMSKALIAGFIPAAMATVERASGLLCRHPCRHSSSPTVVRGALGGQARSLKGRQHV